MSQVFENMEFEFQYERSDFNYKHKEKNSTIQTNEVALISGHFGRVIVTKEKQFVTFTLCLESLDESSRARLKVKRTRNEFVMISSLRILCLKIPTPSLLVKDHKKPCSTVGELPTRLIVPAQNSPAR
jgi:hypothetical protein